MADWAIGHVVVVVFVVGATVEKLPFWTWTLNLNWSLKRSEFFHVIWIMINRILDEFSTEVWLVGIEIEIESELNLPLETGAAEIPSKQIKITKTPIFNHPILFHGRSRELAFAVVPMIIAVAAEKTASQLYSQCWMSLILDKFAPLAKV